MPRTCTVCGHVRRHEIEQAMLAREPFRAIARRFGLSKDALLRHHDDHLPAALVQSARAAEVTRSDDLVGRLLELNRETGEILARARAVGNDEIALKAIARIEKQVELQAKLIGQLQENTTINITLSAEWLSIQGTIIAALDPWPEARLAVAAALEGGRHAPGRA
jgi:hypothetical protein